MTAGDDGRPDPRLAAALAGWTAQPTPAARAQVLAALPGARVFLALAARASGTEVSPTTGLVQERTAEMALLSVVGASGARALPVFSDGHAVQLWRPEARPVPVPGQQACATALDDGAAALLVDPTGAAFTASRDEVAALAAGHVPVPGSRLTTRRTTTALTTPADPVDPALLAALAAALEPERVVGARLLQGPDGPVLGVVLQGAADPAALAALAARVAGRLGDRLPADGIDLAVVATDGPGVEVPLRRRRRWPGRRR